MKSGIIPIIPTKKTIANIDGAHELDLRAICVFMATGFFLDSDTYWKDEKVLAPGTNYTLDEASRLVSQQPWFQWHHTPRELSFEEALEEFTALFELIVASQTHDQKVILPISGGLDSRTQAVALRQHPQVNAISYAFEGGYPEHKIARQVAEKCNFPFQAFTIERGYLWERIETLATINECYSEFTHPRQMAVTDELAPLGTVFSLGHMGDLMFDTFGLPQMSFEEEVQTLTKMLLKKGGPELASALWTAWNLEGNFQDYFTARISALLKEIKIEDTNAKFRAFKTRYYVSRWSSNNLSVFNAVHPVTLPYYDDRMCEFICTLPEKYLAKRRLQIAYIQQQAPDLAQITWQGQKPFNLNNYHLNKFPYHLPYRIAAKVRREINGFFGKPYISRNWELQFLGKENEEHLQSWLFESQLKELVPNHIIQEFYHDFSKKDALKNAHPVSMLLTLALFQKKFNID